MVFSSAREVFHGRNEVVTGEGEAVTVIALALSMADVSPGDYAGMCIEAVTVITQSRPMENLTCFLA
jgi:hypothetical protein